MLHTKESIMQALGLDPNFSGIFRAPTERGTGRTTSMIIDAAVALQYAEVCVVGYCEAFTRDLNWYLNWMCSRVGIDTSNLIRIDGHHDNVARKLAHLGYLLSEVQIFYDHYFGADRNYNGMRVTQIIMDDPFVPARNVDRQSLLDFALHDLHIEMSNTVGPLDFTTLEVDEKCSKCKYCSGSPYLRCTPFPEGEASECLHFEVK
jgi:hypothetical protein